MCEIKDPKNYEVSALDGMTWGTVYHGGVSWLVRCNEKLKWREDGERKFLTLDEIKEQVCQLYDLPLITVIIEGPLEGVILQYGNYDDSWWEIGELIGYA